MFVLKTIPQIECVRAKDAKHLAKLALKLQGLAVSKPEDLRACKQELLVKIFNHANPKNKVTGFPSVDVATAIVFETVRKLADGWDPKTEKGGIAPAGTSDVIVNGQPARTKAERAAANKGKAIRLPPPAKVSTFAGKTLHRKKPWLKKNPRQPDSWGWKSFNVIKDGMTYEAYLKAGGRPQDLRWDVAHDFVEVK